MIFDTFHTDACEEAEQILLEFGFRRFGAGTHPGTLFVVYHELKQFFLSAFKDPEQLSHDPKSIYVPVGELRTYLQMISI